MCEGWWSQKHSSVEWVGLRFGLRKLSYQHCFRVGQPAPLSSSTPFIPDSLLHFYIISLPPLSVFPVWLVLISPPSPLSLAHLHSFRGLTLFRPPLSPPVLRLLHVWEMTLPPGLSILAPRPHSFLTAPTLLELESETSTFLQLQKSCKGSWMTLFYLLVLPWKMDVHKHIIIRGWSLRSWLPAPKHLTSRLHVRLFLSKGLQLGFQESFPNSFCRKLSPNAP